MTKTYSGELRSLYLNGEWFHGGQPLNVTNPATGELLAQVATVDREGVRQAVDDANRAWRGWRKLTGKERGAHLRRIAEALEDRAEEFARTITLENGKPLAQSRGEVAMSVDHLQWFAEEARRTKRRASDIS